MSCSWTGRSLRSLRRVLLDRSGRGGEGTLTAIALVALASMNACAALVFGVAGLAARYAARSQEVAGPWLPRDQAALLLLVVVAEYGLFHVIGSLALLLVAFMAVPYALAAAAGAAARGETTPVGGRLRAETWLGLGVALACSVTFAVLDRLETPPLPSSPEAGLTAAEAAMPVPSIGGCVHEPSRTPDVAGTWDTNDGELMLTVEKNGAVLAQVNGFRFSGRTHGNMLVLWRNGPAGKGPADDAVTFCPGDKRFMGRRGISSWHGERVVAGSPKPVPVPDDPSLPPGGRPL